MTRKATAVWNGSGKEGSGRLSSQSGILSNTPYSYKSRFEEGTGTNPEELIAAAHAGCFNMKLSFSIGAAGFMPDYLETTAEVTLENGSIIKSHLILKGKVPHISEEEFDDCVEDAKSNCPVSRLLSTEITVDKTLVR